MNELSVLALPDSLRRAVRVIRAAEPGSQPAIWHDPAATGALAQMAPHLAPADIKACERWLRKVATGVNVWEDRQLQLRVVAVWAMCGDLPASVWCDETVRAIWAATPYLPTPGEVRRVLTAHAAPLLSVRDALRRIEEAPPAPPVAREALGYAPPPSAPDWVASRAVRGSDGRGEAIANSSRWSGIHPPVRTVAEQLAALRTDGAPN